MEIKVFGIALNKCPAVTADELWNEMKSHATKQITALGEYLQSDSPALPLILQDGQIMVVQEYETTYKAGIILKIKDAKSWFAVENKGGKLRVSAEDLDANQRQIEINFFLFKSDSLKGLYAYYHQSSHMNDLGRLFRDGHERVLRRKRLELDELHSKGQLTAKQVKAARKDLTSLSYEIMTKGGDAATLVNNLSKIKKLKLVFSDWGSQAKGDMSPLVTMAKSATVEMSFDATTNLGSLKTTIGSLIASATKLKKLRVEGTDPGDLDQVINLERNLDDFNRVDYDAFTKTTREVNLSDLENSWTSSAAFKWLKKTAETGPVINRLKANNAP